MVKGFRTIHIPLNTYEYFVEDQKVKKKSFLNKLIHYYMLAFILFSLSFLIVIIGMTILWNLLCAIINPTGFLPYAAAIGSFIAFAYSQFKSFKLLHEKGEKSVSEAIEEDVICHPCECFRKKSRLNTCLRTS